MSNNHEAEVVLEMYQSVDKSQAKQKRLKSSTFWKLFKIKSRKKPVVENIAHLVNEQGLNIKVKSGAKFGEEDKDDWIMLTPKILPEMVSVTTGSSPAVYPENSWFETIINRIFETEREVETYFIVPILDKLGYNYDDICIGYTLEMFRGVKKTKAVADFVIFDGESREKIDVLVPCLKSSLPETGNSSCR